MRSMLRSSVLVLASTPALLAQEVTLYSTDFSTLEDWTVVTGCDGPQWRWAADATPATHPAGPYVSPPASLNFNDGTNIGGGDYGGPTTCGRVTSNPIDLSLAASDPRLRFLASWNCETGCQWDILSLWVRSAETGAVLFSECVNTTPSSQWIAFEFPLQKAWGQVRIEFEFDSVDGWESMGSGPFIDDLAVVYDLPVSYSVLCRGDGSGTPCPCSNPGSSDEGCRNSTGAGARLIASGSASTSLANLVLSTTQLRPNQFGTYLQGSLGVNGGQGISFGDGLRCAGGSVVRLQQRPSDSGGSSATTIDVAARGGVLPGDTRTYQIWYRDPFTGPCGSGFNLSNGIQFTWLP